MKRVGYSASNMRHRNISTKCKVTRSFRSSVIEARMGHTDRQTDWLQRVTRPPRVKQGSVTTCSINKMVSYRRETEIQPAGCVISFGKKCKTGMGQLIFYGHHIRLSSTNVR